MRRLLLKVASATHLLPFVVRVGVAFALRRRVRQAGLRLERGPDGSFRLTLPGSPDRAVVLAKEHAPYTLDVADHFSYYHGAVASQSIDGVALVDYSSPREHRLQPSGDTFLFTGFAEPEETTEVYLAHAQLAAGDLVLDLGAYCGASTISFAKAVGPTGHVVAFEPDRANAAALRENVNRHGLTNVTIVEAGIWRASTVLQFSAEGNMGSALAAVLPRATHTESVRVLSMADAVQYACAKAGIQRVSFVKMDIEGAEVAVLEAAQDFLREHRPRLVIEPHRTEAGAGLSTLNTDQIVSLLTRAGQSCTLAMQGVGAHPLILASPEPLSSK
jgi:FkbM family methyltransferase